MNSPRTAALAAVVPFVVVAAALAANHSQTIQSTVQPSTAGTSKKPKPVELGVHLHGSTTDGTVPPAAKRVVMSFGKGIVVNGAKFKSCTLDTLNDANKGPKKCPTDSKVGSGTAVAHIGNDPTGPNESLKVQAFNGPSGKSILFHVSGTQPVAVNAAFAGKLAKASGAYGYKLDVTIPKALYNPVGATYTPLTDFNTKISRIKKVSGKTVSFVTTTSCPAGKSWAFKGQWTYANAPEGDIAQTTVKCH